MSFAILFIFSFIVGLLIYRINRQWIPAVVIPMVLFTLNTLADLAARDAWGFTLIFGLPIVFFGSLLGAYILQTRTADSTTEEPDEDGS